MRACFDTAVLVKAYVEEPDSAVADGLLGQCALLLAFTPLHALETRNALRLKRFRGELSADELSAGLDVMREDLQAGRLTVPALDHEAVYQCAERLTSRHTATTGARSLDLLHVAAALELGAEAFVSLGLRQRTVAQREGLRLLPARMPAARDPRRRSPRDV
jgi:hypothetical protein